MSRSEAMLSVAMVFWHYPPKLARMRSQKLSRDFGLLRATVVEHFFSFLGLRDTSVGFTRGIPKFTDMWTIASVRCKTSFLQKPGVKIPPSPPEPQNKPLIIAVTFRVGFDFRTCHLPGYISLERLRNGACSRNVLVSTCS